MKVETQDDKTISSVERRKSFTGKFKGLMFREKGRILMEWSVKDRYGIWMPFMKFPIDVAFISEDKKVVTVFENVPPISLKPSTWKVYKPSKMCKYILEVESGLLSQKGIREGDRLLFPD